MVNIEDLTEEELNKLRLFYKKLAELDESHCDFGEKHSIDAARLSHEIKHNIANSIVLPDDELSLKD